MGVPEYAAAVVYRLIEDKPILLDERGIVIPTDGHALSSAALARRELPLRAMPHQEAAADDRYGLHN